MSPDRLRHSTSAPSIDIEQAKQALRERKRSWLREVEPAARTQAGERAAELIFDSPEFHRAPRLLLYAALPSELPTRALFEGTRAAGKRCLLPRCLPGDVLEFAEIEAWSQLEQDARFGVLEPPHRAPAEALEQSDLVILPGLAFSPKGQRLGRGRGFYDRTFAHWGGTLFGLGFQGQIEPEVPCGPHDRLLDAVVSEEGLIRVRRHSNAP